MIQRIQTLYLFLTVCVFVLLAFFAPVQFVVNNEYTAPQTIQWALWVLNILIPLIALVDIFLFKKRILQVRINVVNVILMLGYYIVLVGFTYFNCQQMNADWYLNWSAGLPLIGLVLTMMAVRAILKDEALVRAADRLR